jgi:hypothetical protein
MEMDYYEYRKLHDQYYRRNTVRREPPKKQEEPEETIEEAFEEAQPSRGVSLLNTLRTRIARPQEETPEESETFEEPEAPPEVEDAEEVYDEEDEGEGIFFGIAGRFKNLFRRRDAQPDEDDEEEDEPKKSKSIEKKADVPSAEKLLVLYGELLSEEEPTLSRAERRKLRETEQDREDGEESKSPTKERRGKRPESAPDEEEEEEDEEDTLSFFSRLKGRLLKYPSEEDEEDEEEEYAPASTERRKGKRSESAPDEDEEEEDEEDTPSFFSRLKGRLLKHLSEEDEEDEDGEEDIPPLSKGPRGKLLKYPSEEGAEDENEDTPFLPEEIKAKLVKHPSVVEYGEIEEEGIPAPIEAPKDDRPTEEENGAEDSAPSPFEGPTEQLSNRPSGEGMEGEEERIEKALPRQVRRALIDETGGDEVPSLFSIFKKRPKADKSEEDDEEESEETEDKPSSSPFRGLFKDEEDEPEEEYEEEGAPPSLLLSLKQILPKRDPSEKVPARKKKRLQYLPPIDEDDDDAPNTKSKALRRFVNPAPVARRFEDDEDALTDEFEEDDDTFTVEAEEEMPPREKKTEVDEMTDYEKQLRRMLGEDAENTQRVSRRERRAAQEKGNAEPEGRLVEEATREFKPEPDEPTQEFKPVRPRTARFSRPASLSSYDDDDDDIVPIKKARGFKKPRFEDDEDEGDEKEYGASGDIYDDEDISSYDDYDDEDDEDEDDEYGHDIGFGKRVLRFFKGLLTLVLILAILYCGLLLLENAGVISLGFIRNTALGRFLPAQKAEPADADTMPEVPEGEQLTPEEEAELYLSEEDGMQGSPDFDAETQGDAATGDEDIAAP